jgi:galactonate dehydratase
MDIMIDLHGPPWLTPADAARVARALEPYELEWIEDPIAPENLDGYRRIRDAAHVPLASGERMATIFGERELIERELVDVIQPDTGRAGGITQMRKIAAMAEAHHIMFAPHSGSLGPVAEYAALHLMAALPNALILERIEDDWEGRAKTVIPHPHQQDGFIKVPDAPGLGVDIDEAFVAAHPSKGNVAIQTTRESKSYTEGTFDENVYVQTRLGRKRYFNPGDRS